jgi:hypothetical protein
MEFECNICHTKATTEVLTEGILIVHCEACDVHDLWGEAEPEALDGFTILLSAEVMLDS